MLATGHAPSTLRHDRDGTPMSMARRLTTFLLTRTPAPVRAGIRKLTPGWAYQAIARAAAGGSLRRTEPGRLFLSDKHVIALEQRLWQGFSHSAKADLDALLDERAPPPRGAEAAMVLARFQAANGAYADALEKLDLVVRTLAPLARHRRAQVIRVHSLMQLGHLDQARTAAEQARADQAPRGHADLDILLASMALAESGHGMCPADEAVDRYLAGISEPLERVGLAALARRDRHQPLGLGNLAPTVPPSTPAAMPARVSVLMAVHNRQAELAYAVGSVLAQTWRNLELVVVDDASTDDSWAVLQTLAAQDTRIVPIRLDTNGGAYVARNAALQAAGGDYVTVHDADDWSHPQKIERQVTDLLQHPQRPGNVTDWFRVGSDMQVQPRLDLFQVPVVHKNFSSLMLPRTTALEMGGWDTVRMSADAEFIERLQARAGTDAIPTVLPGIPLSISLLETGNLTAASATGIRTSQFGARHAYARQYREWHRSGADLRMARTSPHSPFPVPGICCGQTPDAGVFDVILVSHFRGPETLALCRRQSGRIAIVVWPDYQAVGDLDIDEAITRWCRETGTVTLVHGETARCHQLIIDPPEIMRHRLDKVPRIHADVIHVPRPGECDPTIERHIHKVFSAAAFNTPEGSA